MSSCRILRLRVVNGFLAFFVAPRGHIQHPQCSGPAWPARIDALHHGVTGVVWPFALRKASRPSILSGTTQAHASSSSSAPGRIQTNLVAPAALDHYQQQHGQHMQDMNSFFCWRGWSCGGAWRVALRGAGVVCSPVTLLLLIKTRAGALYTPTTTLTIPDSRVDRRPCDVHAITVYKRWRWCSGCLQAAGLCHSPLSTRSDPPLIPPHQHPPRPLSRRTDTSATFATMSDVNAHIIQPLKKFAKDSTHLVKKCTKPDRKGKPTTCLPVVVFPHSSLATPFPSLLLHASLVPPKPLYRVRPDSLCHERGVPDNGLYWLLRQAHPHPYQQHLARRHLG